MTGAPPQKGDLYDVDTGKTDTTIKLTKNIKILNMIEEFLLLYLYGMWFLSSEKSIKREQDEYAILTIDFSEE